MIKKVISSLMLVPFVVSMITPVGAQMLPVSGTRVGLTAGLATDGLGIPSDIASRSSVSFQPPVLLGLKIHPENPLLFDFIVDQGESRLSEDDLKAETEKLVKYFLAALTIPDKEVWVNLSPYEKDRIIPDVLGQTTMGKTMLEQDYLLKQLASSLTNPEEKLGQEFWGKVKAQVGGSDVPMNTFNKVWIVPQKAEVLESQGIVLVGEKRLKVMMADDYTAMNMSSPQSQSLSSPNAQSLSSPQSLSGDPLAKNGFPIKDFGNDKNIKAFGNDNSNVSSQVFRDVILPNIEKEINEGKNFADVRQIYNSVILAAWYKKALKESLLGKVYTDKGKVAGVETDDKDMKQRIYEQYLSAFKKGVYNLIKEESDVISGDIIPRKYFSGGLNLSGDQLERKVVALATIEQNLNASSGIIVATVQGVESGASEQGAVQSQVSSSAVQNVNSTQAGRVQEIVTWLKNKMRDLFGEKSLVEVKFSSDLLNRLQEIRAVNNEAPFAGDINEDTLRKVVNFLNGHFDDALYGQSKVLYYHKGYHELFALKANDFLPNSDDSLTQIAAKEIALNNRLDAAVVILRDLLNFEPWTLGEQAMSEGQKVSKLVVLGFKVNGQWARYSELKPELTKLGVIIASSAVNSDGKTMADVILENSALLEGSQSAQLHLLWLLQEDPLIQSQKQSEDRYKDIAISAESKFSAMTDEQLGLEYSRFVGRSQPFYQPAFVKNENKGIVGFLDVLSLKDTNYGMTKLTNFLDDFVGNFRNVRPGALAVANDNILAVYIEAKAWMREVLSRSGVTAERDATFEDLISGLRQNSARSTSQPAPESYWQFEFAINALLQDVAPYPDAFREDIFTIFMSSLVEYERVEETRWVESITLENGNKAWVLSDNGVHEDLLQDYDRFAKFFTAVGVTKEKGLNRQVLTLSEDFISKINAIKANASSAIEEADTVSAPIVAPGGIDFDPTNMNLQIKRDGKGVPLPIPQQNFEQINIQGLSPVIINIMPVNAQTLPIFLGQASKDPAIDPKVALSTAS
ncbi:MAG: hypothetical protein H6754_00220 [Candidatus Omnitrophica bacterium]|nr:hypothetical protein [Candidatus Omnitrophota bacterium]